MISLPDLPITRKLLGAVGIAVLPVLILSCVALLAFGRYHLGSIGAPAAYIVPVAVICACSTLLVLLLLRVVTEPILRELASSNDRAKSALRARSDLLASMSHEMRTPLHAILSFAELGGRSAASLTPEKAARYYKLIEDGGRRLLDLLTDAVDLADLEAGKRVLRFASQPVESVVRGVVDELRPVFLSRGIGFEAVTCEARSGWIDRDALMQVVRSVLTNAAAASGPGGTVEVALARSEKGSLLSVARRGPKSEARVSALKLALCRGIMKLHGGRIWAEAADASGETVYLEIPDQNRPPAAVPLDEPANFEGPPTPPPSD